jgi:signal transduction histidine kinase
MDQGMTARDQGNKCSRSSELRNAPPELIGQSLRALYASDEDYERVGRLAEQADAGEGHAEPIRASFRRKSGELFPGELIATIIRDRRRNVLGVMRFVRDISGQLKQEQVLRQNQRMDALGQLTGGIAHDFNNLLTVMQSPSYQRSQPAKVR